MISFDLYDAIAQSKGIYTDNPAQSKGIYITNLTQSRGKLKPEPVSKDRILSS
jgi:hypothetical protein